jgi:3-dehydroquinate synthase
VTNIRIDISTTPANGYDVVVEPGSLGSLGSRVPSLMSAHRYAVISDSNVAPLWGNTVVSSLERAGLAVDLVVFPAGESSKTRETWAALSDELLARGLGRDAGVLALGGGVVGDLGGFVAATFMRGLPYLQLPTTLLAMIDAAIGGKTGIDAPAGKNLVGAFHQPKAVIVDPLVLRTLPEPELRGGLAEAIKHGAIADERYLLAIENAAASLLRADADRLTDLIVPSIRIKAGFVAADTQETGARAALNFGHTIGHAIERAAGYRLHHGYAVAIGMMVEAAIGETVGTTAAGSADRLAAILGKFDLPVRVPPDLTVQQILDYTTVDKKARAGAVRYVLITKPGNVARGPNGEWTHEVPTEIVRSTLQRFLK